jgi:hypothetical protein
MKAKLIFDLNDYDDRIDHTKMILSGELYFAVWKLIYDKYEELRYKELQYKKGAGEKVDWEKDIIQWLVEELNDAGINAGS